MARCQSSGSSGVSRRQSRLAALTSERDLGACCSDLHPRARRRTPLDEARTFLASERHGPAVSPRDLTLTLIRALP